MKEEKKTVFITMGIRKAVGEDGVANKLLNFVEKFSVEKIIALHKKT